MPTDCSAEQFDFESVEGLAVEAAFRFQAARSRAPHPPSHSYQIKIVWRKARSSFMDTHVSRLISAAANEAQRELSRRSDRSTFWGEGSSRATA
jgi:hypothetical protein